MTNYELNIDAIEEIAPAFAEMITDSKNDETPNWLSFDLRCETGEANALIAYGAGREPVHIMADPIKAECETLRAVKHQLARDEVSVIVGIGLGHGVKAIFDECEKGHTVIAVEPVISFIRAALHEYDFSDRIRAGRLLLCRGSREELSMNISIIDERVAPRDWFVSYLPHVLRRYEYSDALRIVSETINATRCNSGTVTSAGTQIATNDVDTIPYLVDKRGVIELVDIFKDKPAVVVCTGPSLERNIGILSKYQDRVVIVAVAQALRPLLAHDITPDFICTVDFGEVNFSHLDRLMDCGVPLITINRTYARLVQEWRGPMFVVASAPGDDSRLSGIFNDRGMLPQGGSVAHMALQTALALGCKTVMLTGQDLALPDGKSHTAQADTGGNVSITERGEIRWKVNDPRSIIKDGDHSMGPALQVPGYYGNAVLTNVGLQSFKTSLENMIEAIPDAEGIKIVNATEGGAAIKGAEPIWLDDAIEEFAPEPFDKALKAELLTPLADGKERRATAIKFASEELKHNQAARKAINAVKVNLKQIKDTAHTTGRKRARSIQKLLEVNLRLNNTAHEFIASTPVLAVATFHAERAIRSRAANMQQPIDIPTFDTDSHEEREKKRRLAMRAHLSKKKNVTDLLHIVDRNTLILDAALDAIKVISKSLRTAHDVMVSDTKKTTSITPSSPAPMSIADFESYFDAGNYAFPLVESRRCVQHSDRTHEDALYATLTAQMTATIKRAKKMRTDALRRSTRLRTKQRVDGWDTKPRYHFYVAKAQRIGATTRDFKQAIPFLRKAIEIDDSAEIARRGLSNALLLIEEYKEAHKLLAALVEEFPDNMRYLFEYGQAAIMAGKLTAGIKAINDAVAKEPEQFAPFLPAVGDLYMEKGLHERAVDVYQQYLDYDAYKYDALVWEKLATCFKALDRKSAEDEARRRVDRLRKGQ